MMLDELPNNHEIECALIGTLFAYPDELEDTAAKITPDCFYWQANRIIYNTMLDIYRQHASLSATVVKAELEAAKMLDDIGGGKYLGEVINCAMLSGSIPEYCRLLLDLYQRREAMQTTMRAYQELGRKDPERPAAKVISDMEDRLYSITQDQKTNQLLTMEQAVRIALDDIERAYNNPGIQGIPTGLNSIDNILKGLNKGALYILAGRPAMGKSALAMNITTHAAANGHHVMFCSLEMPAEQIIQRMIASETMISTQKMSSGDVSADQAKELMMAGSKIRSLPITWNDKPPLTSFSLLSQARRVRPDLIVVDFLQLMDGPSEYRGQRVQQITEISRNLKLMALQLDIPVIALSQLSRGVEQRENKRPMLSDLRESGSIEQDADVVMFVYRDEYYAMNSAPQKIGAESDANFQKREAAHQERLEESKGKAEVIVAKHRGGAVGTANLKFAAARTTFYE